MMEKSLLLCVTGVHILNITLKGCLTSKATTIFDSTKMSLVAFNSKKVTVAPEQSLMLLKNPAILPPASRLPAKVIPIGLSRDRKQYLFREW